MAIARKNRRRLFGEALEQRVYLAADAGVIPVQANAFGTSYGELAGDWWNWAAIEPVATSPVLDETGQHCGANQSGKIWYLAGNFGGESTRDCTIPTGKAIFLPVLNSVWFATEPEDTEESLRASANADIDDPVFVNATLDGKEIDPEKYRAESPAGGFTLSVPDGSLFTSLGVDAGDYAPSVSDGYWLLLAPLSKGSHELTFSGEAASGFALSLTYNLEVVGGKAVHADALQTDVAHIGIHERYDHEVNRLSDSVKVAVEGASPAQLDRIQDAVTALNQSTPDYSFTIVDGSTPARGADIYLQHAATSPGGGADAGVLGYFDGWDTITIVNEWDFYDGTDTSGISAAQYDYQSVVTHELLHSIGRQHNDDPNSILNATLSPGRIFRSNHVESSLADSVLSRGTFDLGSTFSFGSHSRSTYEPVVELQVDAAFGQVIDEDATAYVVTREEDRYQEELEKSNESANEELEELLTLLAESSQTAEIVE